MKQLRIFFLCLVAATLVTACGGDDKDNSTPVEKITLDKDKLTFVAQWKMHGGERRRIHLNPTRS